MSTTSSASSKDGARATTSPPGAITTLCPSKMSSSCPPTAFTSATQQSLSRARFCSISSRSIPLPRWNGDAERFVITRAPACASSVIGGPSSQMSSQIVGPMTVSPSPRRSSSPPSSK